jgi:hypothetical protein
MCDSGAFQMEEPKFTDYVTLIFNLVGPKNLVYTLVFAREELENDQESTMIIEDW